MSRTEIASLRSQYSEELSLRGAERRNLDDNSGGCSVAYRPFRRRTHRRRLGPAVAVILLGLSGHAFGEESAALYQAYWAGVPAGEIRLSLRDDAASYRTEIAVRSQGLPWALTHFRATAVSEGRLAADRPLTPARYDALYDLRKGRDRRLSMSFVSRAGALFAERGPADTSKKPPLAEAFRKNVLDPLSTVAAIRHELRRGNRGSFAVPVYDGARRFDVRVRVLPKKANTERVLHLELTLAPIAGFKGESSDEGDPDNAPRPVALTISDDARLMPLAMTVAVAHLPLVVELARWCSAAAPCE
jgi:hypothetical protein